MGGWNKGLTKETDERVARNAVAISVALKGRIPYNAIAATRGKTFEEIHGVKKAAVLKGVLSSALKGNKNALGIHHAVKTRSGHKERFPAFRKVIRRIWFGIRRFTFTFLLFIP